MRLLFALLIFYQWPAFISAYPSAPGTCNMNKMATVGHGPSQSTCADCYGVKISTDSPPLVNIHLTGRFDYQGIVLLVKDKLTNRTVGEFQNFNEDLFTAVACDDDEEPEDQIEPDSTAVLGHIDPKLKGWPVDVGWDMIATKPVTELKLQGMVVIDYDNFHLLPETEFKIKRKVEKQVTVTKDPVATTTETGEATQTIIEVEHEPGTVVQRETNTLFMWVLTIFVFIYFALSVLHRQFKKRK